MKTNFKITMINFYVNDAYQKGVRRMVYAKLTAELGDEGIVTIKGETDSYNFRGAIQELKGLVERGVRNLFIRLEADPHSLFVTALENINRELRRRGGNMVVIAEHSRIREQLEFMAPMRRLGFPFYASFEAAFADLDESIRPEKPSKEEAIVSQLAKLGASGEQTTSVLAGIRHAGPEIASKLNNFFAAASHAAQ